MPLVSPTNGSGFVGAEVIDADGEQNTAAVVYWRGTTGAPLTILVGDSTLASPTPSLTRTYKEAVLLPIGTSSGNADVVWTGSSYLVGFVNSAASPSVALVDTSANIVGGVQPLTTPGSPIGSPIRVAASGSTLAAAYIDQTSGNHAAISILSSSGAPQVGPIVLPNVASVNTTMWALAGTAGGYVIAYKDTSLGDVVTFVASDGTIGKTLKLPQQGTTQGMGVSDAAGAGFALRYPDGTHFVYARGPLDTLEETTAITPSNPNTGSDFSSLSARAGRMTAFHFAYNESRMYAIDVGCP